jgi:hypothetical protein
MIQLATTMYFPALKFLDQSDTSGVVLEDSEILKVTKSECGHRKRANMKDISSSSNNFMTNSHTVVIIYNIIVSNHTNSNKNICSNKNRNIVNSNGSSKFPPDPLIPIKSDGKLKSIETQRSHKSSTRHSRDRDGQRF